MRTNLSLREKPEVARYRKGQRKAGHFKMNIKLRAQSMGLGLSQDLGPIGNIIGLLGQLLAVTRIKGGPLRSCQKLIHVVFSSIRHSKNGALL